MLDRRAAGAEDEAFLRALFELSREREFATLPLPEPQRTGFIDMQFRAQQSHYRAAYPNAVRDIVTWRGEPIGNLTVERSVDEFRLIDVNVLPEWRERGIGTRLIQDLVEEGAQLGCPVVLHVATVNPARRLYARLGFHEVSSDGIYAKMATAKR